ncbi:hypothetical protein PG995_011129 [Apiospora arundinis]
MLETMLPPYSIARHHKSSWASPEQRRVWLDKTSQEISQGTIDCITWQLDADMLSQKGWSGYTCRHRRNNPPIPLDELDGHEIIKAEDQKCRKQGLPQRRLTVLLMTEYPARMRELAENGHSGGVEYLLTAFMTAITILHELAHAIYWRDFRSLGKGMREPYYGADLEMELGESFIAHLFGGYVPVPIKGITDLQEGLAWKQFLSWDSHKARPKYRAHYSISTEYISELFQQNHWESARKTLLQDQTLLRSIGPASSNPQRQPCFLLPDFHLTCEGWKWKRRPGAPFRIPQYDEYMFPDLSLPTAPDDLIIEPQPRRQPTVTTERRNSTSNLVDERHLRPNGDLTTAAQVAAGRIAVPEGGIAVACADTKSRSYLEVPHISFSGLDQLGGCAGELMTKKAAGLGSINCELTVDELKKRLSHLIGISLCELETLFDGHGH